MKTFTTALLAGSLTTLVRVAAIVEAGGVDRPFVVLSVVDDETGAPVERLLVVPGVPYSGTAERSVAAWQPHLAREVAGGHYEWPRERSYETFRLRVEADGYRPSMTGWLHKAADPADVTIRLRRDPGLRGVILMPNGSPATGATMGIALPNRTLRLKGRTIDRAGEPTALDPRDRWRQPITARVDGDGRFRLPTETDPAALLVVVHEHGYLERPVAELLAKDAERTSSLRLELGPWGRIAGQLLWGNRPGWGEEIELIVSHERLYPDMVGTSAWVRSDARGRFEFRDVPPGHVQLSRPVPGPDGKGASAFRFPVLHVDVRAGGATEVVLGGRGQMVAGRLTGLDSYEGLTLRIHPVAPHIGFAGDDDQWRGWTALRNSRLGTTVFREAIPVGADGSFRIEGLVPESYQLFVDSGGTQLRGGARFTVKPAASGADDGRQDLPEIRVMP